MKFRPEELAPIIESLGKPDEETSDNRAGYTYFWGTETGPSLFIRRCAFQDNYEAICRPGEDSDLEFLLVEGNTDTLLTWFEKNKGEIVARLKHYEDQMTTSSDESGYSTLPSKNLTTEEYAGYIAGLSAALEAMKGASTFKQAKDDVAALITITQNIQD